MLINLPIRNCFLIPPIIPEIILSEITRFTIIQQIITLGKYKICQQQKIS